MPFAPVVPFAGALLCCYAMLSLGASTWVVFGGWMVIGLALYAGYGRRHSRLNETTPEAVVPPQ